LLCFAPVTQVVFLDNDGNPTHTAADLRPPPASTGFVPTLPIAKPKRPNRSKKGGDNRKRGGRSG
jgi:hypothetical protein